MPEPQYSWSTIRLALQRLHHFNSNFLPNTVLVGGAACWYYRQALIQVKDPDFPAPHYNVEEEKKWVSKDLDFMGDSEEEIGQLIQRPCPPMGELIEYAGVVLDFVDHGFVMTRREAHHTARKVELSDLVFYVADPTLLYMEKQALVQAKSREQDRLHLIALSQFIKWELCSALKDLSSLDPKQWLNSAKTVKTDSVTFFTADAKLCRLLHQCSQGLGPESKAIQHWIKHHVPKPTPL